jgi:hypothetical protein
VNLELAPAVLSPVIAIHGTGEVATDGQAEADGALA